MKKFSILALSFIMALSVAFGIIALPKTALAEGEVSTFAFSETKIKRSSDDNYLLLATGIKNYDNIYEVGYEFEDYTVNETTDKNETTKYYTSITYKTGEETTKTETARAIFGEDYPAMIIWEINVGALEEATNISVQAYACVGTRNAEGQLTYDSQNPEKVYGAKRTIHSKSYTIIWEDEDGSVLETDKHVEYGATPSYDAPDPTKPETEQYTYTFAGWTPAVTPVTGDATYTATYTATLTKAGMILQGLSSPETNFASETYLSFYSKISGAGSYAYNSVNGGITLTNNIRVILDPEIISSAVQKGYTHVTVKMKQGIKHAAWWSNVGTYNSSDGKGKSLLQLNNTDAVKEVKIELKTLYYEYEPDTTGYSGKYVLWFNNANEGSNCTVTEIKFSDEYAEVKAAIKNGTANLALQAYSVCFSGDTTYVDGYLAMKDSNAAARYAYLSSEIIKYAKEQGYSNITFVGTCTNGSTWPEYSIGDAAYKTVSSVSTFSDQSVTVSIDDCLKESGEYYFALKTNRNWAAGVQFTISSFTFGN